MNELDGCNVIGKVHRSLIVEGNCGRTAIEREEEEIRESKGKKVGVMDSQRVADNLTEV